MIAQVTSSALTAENKMLAHPASIDSLPTSANQEDHVSMAAHGALRVCRMAQNAAVIVGIELFAGAQGIDFRARSRPAHGCRGGRGHSRARAVSRSRPGHGAGYGGRDGPAR